MFDKLDEIRGLISKFHMRLGLTPQRWLFAPTDEACDSGCRIEEGEVCVCRRPAELKEIADLPTPKEARRISNLLENEHVAKLIWFAALAGDREVYAINLGDWEKDALREKGYAVEDAGPHAAHLTLVTWYEKCDQETL